jgi:hypothetical protein
MIKSKLAYLYSLVVTGKQKAVMAFFAAAVGSFVARHGFTLDMSLGNALQALLLGALAHLGVYLKSNG